MSSCANHIVASVLLAGACTPMGDNVLVDPTSKGGQSTWAVLTASDADGLAFHRVDLSRRHAERIAGWVVDGVSHGGLAVVCDGDQRLQPGTCRWMRLATGETWALVDGADQMDAVLVGGWKHHLRALSHVGGRGWGVSTPSVPWTPLATRGSRVPHCVGVLDERDVVIHWSPGDAEDPGALLDVLDLETGEQRPILELPPHRDVEEVLLHRASATVVATFTEHGENASVAVTKAVHVVTGSTWGSMEGRPPAPWNQGYARMGALDGPLLVWNHRQGTLHAWEPWVSPQALWRRTTADLVPGIQAPTVVSAVAVAGTVLVVVQQEKVAAMAIVDAATGALRTSRPLPIPEGNFNRIWFAQWVSENGRVAMVDTWGMGSCNQIPLGGILVDTSQGNVLARLEAGQPVMSGIMLGTVSGAAIHGDSAPHVLVIHPQSGAVLDMGPRFWRAARTELYWAMQSLSGD